MPQPNPTPFKQILIYLLSSVYLMNKTDKCLTSWSLFSHGLCTRKSSEQGQGNGMWMGVLIQMARLARTPLRRGSGVIDVLFVTVTSAESLRFSFSIPFIGSYIHYKFIELEKSTSYSKLFTV